MHGTAVEKKHEYQLMHEPSDALNKVNWWQILNFYVFRHRCAVLREPFGSEEYKPKTLIQVLHRPH